MKAVFVGNKPTYDFLSQRLRPNWDWQIPIVSINDFWDRAADGQIDDATSIIMISDEFYQSAKQINDMNLMEDFLSLVFASTQSALTMIVSYFPGNRGSIQADLLRYAGQQEEGTLQQYWWVDSSSPNPDIDGAIKSYINSPDSDPSNVATVAQSEHLNIMADNSTDDVQSNANFDQSEEQYTNSYGKKAQVICVTSSKGGAGKTTCAFGLGAWLSASSRQAVQEGTLPKPLKVCIMDLDVHDAQIGSMIGKSDPTIVKIAIAPEINQDVIQKNLHYSDRMKCWFLLSPKLPNTSDTIPVDKFAETIDVMRYMFDVIILDTSVDYTDPLFATMAFPKATKILFITTLDRRAVIGMGKWIVANGSSTESMGAQIPLGKVCIAINNGMKGVNMTVKEIQRLIDISVSKVYSTLDRSISPDDWQKPALVGAIPEIPNGLLIRLSNIQQFELALSIPPFEKAISQIAKAVMPPAFQNALPNVRTKN